MTESITQTHNGSGDNILGDKIINQSMQAVDFVKVAYNLYYLINIGSFDKAESKLESNIHIPSKSAGVVELLEVLTIYLNFKRSLRVEGDLNTIKRAIRSNPPKLLDLYKSILVEMIYLTSESEALEVYNNFSEDRSFYLENIKLRYFADEDELKEIFSKEIMVLDELGLLFLARGLARVEKRKEALIVLEKINHFAGKHGLRCIQQSGQHLRRLIGIVINGLFAQQQQLRLLFFSHGFEQLGHG